MTAQRIKGMGRADSDNAVNFSWDGRSLQGYRGDTLASALLANNINILGRSFKYHRPRGIMSAGVEESGAIVSVGSGDRHEPNVKATTQELYEGLIANGQNAWPNVRHDFGAISGLFGRFFAAGFYYKTFMGLPPFEWGRGTGIWMQYEKLIRKAAGMGEASRLADPDHYDHAHAFCDVLVVGSGPAGLNAALEAARTGCDVILVEQDFELGGDFLNMSDKATEARRQSLVTALKQLGVRIMTRTTAFGLYDNGTAGLLERVSDHLAFNNDYQPRQRFWTLRASVTILATGALERHIAFADNDRPGVMTVSAARTYLNRYGIRPGQRIVIAGNNDSTHITAAELVSVGCEVTLLEARSELDAAQMAELETAGVSVKIGHAPLQAIGSRTVRAVKLVQSINSHWQLSGEQACDLLLVSGGWSPVVNLQSHHGASPVWNSELACFLPGSSQKNVVMAGSATGVWDSDACEQSGVSAATMALGETATRPEPGGWVTPIEPLYEVHMTGHKGKRFVDLQHDVTTDDVRLAHQEGFVSVEHLKRYTTLGMATDQGKMGNIIGLAIMAQALGKDIPQVGTTRFRPPYTPVAIGALAGRNVGAHFKTLRRTPLHDWNLQNGATMTDAGQWHRPWYFAAAGETIADAYVREATTVRQNVGLCDVSSLGKISVQGPDAAEFLNRIYTNVFASLAVGKARYGIMLRDDGMVMDDGTTWRLSQTNYLLTTTTLNAGKVMVWLEELLQIRWPELKVHVTSVSDQWAGLSVAGPMAREVIAACLEDADVISSDNLPFMGVVSTHLQGGIECLIARISFSGELAFEVYTPSGYAQTMTTMLWATAEKMGGCLYGLEALGTLRIEKGHVTGAELDGRVTIDDAGLGKMASTKKPFIGSALRGRSELIRTDRPQLVGIFPKDRFETFNGGALLCKPGEVSGFGEGWITAVTHSPVFGHWIGLGYICGGHEAWKGKDVVAADPVRKGNTDVEIVSAHMYDPKGERMHV